MHNCVWYFWTCRSQNTGLHNFGGQIGLGYFLGGEIGYSYFCQSIAPNDSKMLKWKKALQRIIIRFSNFGSNCEITGGFSLMGQGIGKSPALAKNLLIYSLPPRKISQLIDSTTKFLSPSTKSLNTKFHVLTK